MSVLSRTNTQVIEELVADYKKLHPIKKSFFPKTLKDTLKSYSASTDIIETTYHIVEKVLHSPFLFQFACITQFMQTDLAKTCTLLKSNHLFSLDNIEAVLAHPLPHRLFSAIRILNDKKLLTGNAAQVNFDAVVQHQKAPDKVCSALVLLHANNLLNELYRQTVAQHPVDPTAVANCVNRMHCLGLLNDPQTAKSHCALLANHADPASVYEGLMQLSPSHEELQQQFEIIIRSKCTLPAALSILALSNETISVSPLKEQIIDAPLPGKIAATAIDLKKSGVSNLHQFFNAVECHSTEELPPSQSCQQAFIN